MGVSPSESSADAKPTIEKAIAFLKALKTPTLIQTGLDIRYPVGTFSVYDVKAGGSSKVSFSGANINWWHSPTIILRDELYIFGSEAPDSGTVYSVPILVPDLQKLRNKGSLSVPRMCVGVGQYIGRFLYVVGGEFNGRYCDTCERFDSLTNKWTVLPRLNQGKSYVTVCVAFPYVYAIGGETGKRTGHLERLGMIGDEPQWELLFPLHGKLEPALYCGAQEIAKDTILVFGGKAHLKRSYLLKPKGNRYVIEVAPSLGEEVTFWYNINGVLYKGWLYSMPVLKKDVNVMNLSNKRWGIKRIHYHP